MTVKLEVTSQIYIAILKEIESNLQMVDQWKEHPERPGWVQNQLKYLHRTEVLVEFLEAVNCGSIGSFDIDQAHTHTLRDRVDWLQQRRPHE